MGNYWARAHLRIFMFTFPLAFPRAKLYLNGTGTCGATGPYLFQIYWLFIEGIVVGFFEFLETPACGNCYVILALRGFWWDRVTVIVDNFFF